MLTVTVDRPDYDDGVPFEISGLGILKNRVPTDIAEVGERNYAILTGKTVREGLGETPDIYKVTGTESLPGSLEDVLGYDPESVNTVVTPPAANGDTSPSTSMGETWEDQQAVEEVSTPVAVPPAVAPPLAVVTDKPDQEGDN